MLHVKQNCVNRAQFMIDGPLSLWLYFGSLVESSGTIWRGEEQQYEDSVWRECTGIGHPKTANATDIPKGVIPVRKRTLCPGVGSISLPALPSYESN